MNITEQIDSRVIDVPDFPTKGIIFKDITPLLADPPLVNGIILELATWYSAQKIDAVAGIESRGFFFGVQLARALHVPFIPIRKEGKLPREKVAWSYELEYGKAGIEVHKDAVENGWNVLIHDDLLATGGTAAAAAEIINLLGGKVAGFSFIIILEFLEGRQKLKKYSEWMHCLKSY